MDGDRGRQHHHDGLTAWSGAATFQSGPAANAVAQQTVDLLAAGYSANAMIPVR